MIKSCLVFLCLLLAHAWVHGDDQCGDKPDGSYGAGCRSYTLCRGGVGSVIDCYDDKNKRVFNKETGDCDSPSNVLPPCGIMKDCSNMANGSYPDLDLACKSFYTCFRGQFFGHNPCPPGLVFHEEFHDCDWIYNVPPPCGTKSS